MDEKKTEPENFKVPQSHFDWVTEFCNETGMSRSKFNRTAIKLGGLFIQENPGFVDIIENFHIDIVKGMKAEQFLSTVYSMDSIMSGCSKKNGI